MNTKLIIVLSVFCINTGFAQNLPDTIKVYLKKVQYNVDTNKICSYNYLAKDSFKNVHENIKLPKGNTIKKYTQVNLKYFTYDTSNSFVLIKALVGYTKEFDLFVLIDKNFNNTFEDDSVYTIQYDRELNNKKDFYALAPIITIDSIPVKMCTGETEYRKKIMKLTPSNYFNGFFKSKKEIEKSQKMSLTLFDTDIWESDFVFKDSVYFLRFSANPMVTPFRLSTNYDYLKHTNFIVLGKKEIQNEIISYGSLYQFITSKDPKKYIKLNDLYLKPIEFNLEQEYIKFIVLNNLDSIKNSVDTNTIKFYRNKNLVTNKWQALIDTAKQYTLVEFSGSWCSPCKKILPAVKKMYTTFKDKMSLKIIIVEESETVAKNYLKQMKVSFDVFFESANIVKNISNYSLMQYLSVVFYPSFYLFDRAGSLIYNGSSNVALEKVKEILKADKMK